MTTLLFRKLKVHEVQPNIFDVHEFKKENGHVKIKFAQAILPCF